MNYYFLPGVGIFGGIKVGFQFVDLLNRLGARSVVATPDGSAPQWFNSEAPVISHELALARCTAEDYILFSLPHDYQWLKKTGNRLVFHCQGTDPLIEPILKDPDVIFLSCWEQATDFIFEKSGRKAIEVGISISDFFYYQGELKEENCVAYMVRRGSEVGRHAASSCPHLHFITIDNADEQNVAQTMKQAEFFLATSVGEWFGLPALEAMAAGCIVLTVPTVGGGAYLRHSRNSILTEPEHLSDELNHISSASSRALRFRMRNNAAATAARYTRIEQVRKLKQLLQGPLNCLL
jgi:glycosyltransferase involved in cell wall biosynthesis